MGFNSMGKELGGSRISPPQCKRLNKTSSLTELENQKNRGGWDTVKLQTNKKIRETEILRMLRTKKFVRFKADINSAVIFFYLFTGKLYYLIKKIFHGFWVFWLKTLRQ